MTRSAARYFANSYGFSRKAFLDALRDTDAAVTAHQNVLANGPREEPLYMDVARIGPPPGAAETVLVMTSAIHGVEGFAGSGIQAGLLREEAYRAMPPTMALVMIHGVNPHGFAHARRVTEGNVDLNRNFLSHNGLYPDDTAYGLIHEIAAPHDLGTDKSRTDRAITDCIARMGLPAFQEAITGGQWSYPDGLFYGGRAPVWSNTTLRTLCVEHTAGARIAAHIDLHTGLGPYGHGEIMGPDGDPPMLALAQDWYGDEVTAPETGNSISAPLRGTVGDLWLALGVDTVAITLEYGTRPFGHVIDALRLDNWLYLHGEVDSPQGADIKATIQDALYPDEDPWKIMIFDRAQEVFARTVRGLSG